MTAPTYSKLVSQLQSRVAIRANVITEATHWKQYHRSLEQMADWRDSKIILKNLTEQQVLDKALLKTMQELAYVEALESQLGLVKFIAGEF